MTSSDELAQETATLELLLTICARQIVGHDDPARYLKWFVEAAPELAPELVAGFPPEPALRQAALGAIGRLIWNRTPLPANGYRPRPLAEPERNAPCPCGSGRKYKHCCRDLEQGLAQFAPFSMLGYVLKQVPAKRFPELPYSRLAPEELSHVALEWLEGGRAKEAALLLEPLFRDVEKLDARHEQALGVLVDCYNNLGRPRKKQGLIEALMQSKDKTLRSAAMHRLCCMHSDAGDYDRAWEIFRDAQRFMPDNPALSHLEVLLLLGQGRRSEAVERGKFWIARLARDRDHDYADLIEALRSLIEEPEEMLLGMMGRGVSGLVEFAEALKSLPPATCHYALHPRGESAGPLEPSKPLRDLEHKWRTMFDPGKPDLVALVGPSPFDWEKAGRLLAWLRKHPAAWSSFEVLDDWVLAFNELGEPFPGFDRKLVVPLLERAEKLLHLALQANRCDGLRLEWGFLDNRPALRLLVNLIVWHEEKGELAEAARLAEWMVLTLNPNDNHGLREDLTRAYIRLGRAQDALRVCERYPDDFSGLTYNHVLALHRLGRLDAAGAALREARKNFPEVYRMLVHPKPRKPRIDPGRVTYGGRDEAWLYREAHLDLWREGGALEWARTSSK